MKLFVSSLQHFSVGDGPGIRTTVFFKGCNLCCPWCHNPETQSSQSVTLSYPAGEQVNGLWMESELLLKELLEDADFYGEEGGVTLSGGEPMLQVEGIGELLQTLKKEGVSAIVDTAGCVPYRSFQRLHGLVDCYYLDVKTPDPGKYRALGGDLELVLNNLYSLRQEGEALRVRIPLIPDYNDGKEDAAQLCRLLSDRGVQSVDLLPFHRLGSGKYRAMGLPYAYAGIPSMNFSHAEKVAEFYKNDFDVKIEQ